MFILVLSTWVYTPETGRLIEYTCSGKSKAPRWAVSFVVSEWVITQCFVLDKTLQLWTVDLIHFLLQPLQHINIHRQLSRRSTLRVSLDTVIYLNWIINTKRLQFIHTKGDRLKNTKNILKSELLSIILTLRQCDSEQYHIFNGFLRVLICHC